VDLFDRAEVRAALRVVLASSPDEVRLFDEAFEQWAPTADGVRVDDPRASPPRNWGKPGVVTLQQWLHPGEVEDDQVLEVRAPSDTERLAQRDFSQWSAHDTAAFAAIAARIARRLRLRRSRRWGPGRGGPIDLRASLRRAVRTGGEPLVLPRRQRRVRRTHLVVACDVSGSMEPYANFLLQFVYALQNAFASVETFVFATRLSRVTDQLRHAEFRQALGALGGSVRDWSGGTRIGASLATLRRDWAPRLTRRTVLLILSDGWDVGDPEHLAAAMADLHRRVGKVIWINPLMGSRDFTPATRGMQASLPWVDVLAPGHNLASLEALVSHLGSC
jgi:uncharacterized protein with von Willebrand factor type A (vWA) domain